MTLESNLLYIRVINLVIEMYYQCLQTIYLLKNFSI